MARAEADAMIAEVTEPFHVYLPWENVRQKQPFRWTLSTDLKKVPDHFVLCKSFGRSSIPRYWLGKLARDGQYIYAKSEFDVPGHLAVKLQFALDIQHNAKNSVEILDAHGDEFIDIDLILPFEIYRLLRALAIEESRVGKWTRRYKISKEHGQLVRHYLLNLEINLAGEG